MPRSQTHALPTRDTLPADAVRAELAQILASDLFSRSERLSAFLRYVVEQTLDGHGGELKEQVLATELYGKGTDFATAADPIVRVDARRLRDKLREYYAAVPPHAVVISMPKGSYTPVFDANEMFTAPGLDAGSVPLGDATANVPAPRRRTRLWLIVAAIVLLGGIVRIAMGRRAAESAPPPFRLLTVTSLPGAEGVPSLSPDGNFVVFTATGPDFLSTADVWVKEADGDMLRRLTDTPQFHEWMPAWSPDGRQIAFQRNEGIVNRGVYLVSPLGGPETKVVDAGGGPSWTPDSLALVMSGSTDDGKRGIFKHTLATGERRQLTSTPPGFVDQYSKVSPDARTLAFVRTSLSSSRKAAIFVVPMANAEGREPVRLTDWSRFVGRLDWTPDGKEILYPSYGLGGTRVFRLAVSGGPPAEVPGIPFGINMLSVSGMRHSGTFRAAFSYGQPDIGLQLVDLHSTTAAGVIADGTPFCDSTRTDVPGPFSRDGVNVAFTSDRGSTPEVWLAERTGASLRRVPGLQAASANAGSWSPDNRRLAFDAIVDDVSDIYVASIDGGLPRRLTDGRAHASDPEWSSDGRWIYYGSDASGRSEIWKIRVDGGPATQVTTDGGFNPREAPDGRTLFYLDAPHVNGLTTGARLKQVSVDGGPSTLALSGVPPGAWDVTDTGIVFVSGGPGPVLHSTPADLVQVYSFADRQVRQIGALPFRIARFGTARLLSVSRDGRWALISHIDEWPRDIVVADNVR